MTIKSSLSGSFFLPTRIIFEPGCVLKHASRLPTYGQKALVVSGRSSFEASGAGHDILQALQQAGLDYIRFSNVEPNPSFQTVQAGAKLGQDGQVDFVLGVGGGSALDAAKAMALLLANPDQSIEDLYAPTVLPALPIVAVPTTAGTGSEVTPYAVLTDHSRQTKRAIRRPIIFPQIALIDFHYTLPLPETISVDTALDAFSHLVEGYLSQQANSFTDAWAEKGFTIFSTCLSHLLTKRFSPETREKLMLVSTLGGMVIAMASTATVHALSYALTYFKNIPHGRANAFLLVEQIKRSLPFTPKAQAILNWLNFSSAEKLQDFFHLLLGPPPSFTPEELRHFASQSLPSLNHQNSLFPVTSEVLVEILQASLRT